MWKNGCKYAGGFVNGLRDGYGVWYESENLTYEG